jgi:hypothetical protein
VELAELLVFLMKLEFFFVVADLKPVGGIGPAHLLPELDIHNPDAHLLGQAPVPQKLVQLEHLVAILAKYLFHHPNHFFIAL